MRIVKRSYTTFLRSIIVLDIKNNKNKSVKLNTILFWLYYHLQRQNVIFDFKQLQRTQIKHHSIVVKMARKNCV